MSEHKLARKPGALAVAGALADLSPFPRLGGLALSPLPQGGVISFRIELSRLSGAVLDLQCGAYMPADQLAAMLRRTADRIEAIAHDYATKHPEPELAHTSNELTREPSSLSLDASSPAQSSTPTPASAHPASPHLPDPPP